MKNKRNLIIPFTFFCIVVILCMILIVALCDKIRVVEDMNKELISQLNEASVQYELLTEDEIETATFAMEIIEPLKEYDKEKYYSEYLYVLEKYEDVLDKPESVYDCFTDEQIQIMWQCIETETFDCSFDAKVNVANVILNRVEHELYPTDPVEIITAKNQFAYGRKNITDSTKLALEYAFMIEDTTNGCIGFRSDSNPQSWNNWEYQFTDGYHYFYK